MSLVSSQFVFADSKPAATSYVEYWNMGEERAARNEEMFTPDFLERRGPNGLAKIMKMVYDDNGEITIHNISTNSDQQIVFIVSSQNGNWLEVSLELAEDMKIAGMGLDMVPPPPGDGDTGLNDAQIASKLEKYMSDRVAAGGFSGSVLLAKQGEILFARAYELADREKGTENTLDTPINLGSMNKMFTGLAIAQLVAQDKLAYDDTVGKYLPEYPDEQVRDEVTVHQLLTHTSGLGSYWTDAYTQAKNYLRRVSDFAQLCSTGPLAFEPGSNFEYSNCGPVVLGLIIEAVSGQNYYDYIRTHVYAPAGMQHSDHYNKVETDSGKAIGYFVPPEAGAAKLISNFDDLGYIGSPAGSGLAIGNSPG